MFGLDVVQKQTLRDQRRAIFNRFMVRNSAHTPKPEAMFHPLIKRGAAKIVRRRGRAPLLVWLNPKRKRGWRCAG